MYLNQAVHDQNPPYMAIYGEKDTYM